MANYNPIHLSHLLKLCLWNHGLEPKSSDYDKLVNTINQNRKLPTALSASYLSNFWTDIKKAIATGDSINKQDEFVQDLLQECEFASWDEYMEDYQKITAYLIPNGDVSQFNENRAVVLCDKELVSIIRPLLNKQKSMIGINANVLDYTAHKNLELEDWLEKCPFVITFFKPSEFDTPYENLEKRKFNSMRDSKRLVPIWNGNKIGIKSIGPMSSKSLLFGDRNILLTLLIIDNLDTISNEEDNLDFTGSGKNPVKIKKNTGSIVLGDQTLNNSPQNFRGTINYNYGDQKKEKQ